MYVHFSLKLHSTPFYILCVRELTGVCVEDEKPRVFCFFVRAKENQQIYSSYHL